MSKKIKEMLAQKRAEASKANVISKARLATLDKIAILEGKKSLTKDDKNRLKNLKNSLRANITFLKKELTPKQTKYRNNLELDSKYIKRYSKGISLSDAGKAITGMH